MDIKELEKAMWATAKKLGNNLDAGVHRHIVLGLIFLKYIIDAFNQQQENSIKGEEASSSNSTVPKKPVLHDPFCLADKAQWTFLQSNAGQPNIGLLIDDAIDTIENLNENLRGILPKNYAQPGLDKSDLGELVSLIGNIGLKKQGQEKKYLYGRVYEYFLKQFAETEGKNGGQFYSPPSVGKLLAEMLEPRKGCIYDSCCGTGGMFVQNEKFIKEHHGMIGSQSFYGQEAEPVTVKLAKMNLGIHGIDADLKLGNTFTNDCHPGLKADFILAHPPFNMRDWQGDRLNDDKRWQYGVPPKENANYAWLQHSISKLSPAGIAGIVLPGSTMYSKTGKEGEIRKNLIEDKLVDCMVALPSQLFYNTDAPACLWLLTRNKTNNRYTIAVNEILFIDARKLGELVSPGSRVLTNDDISLISKTYHRWRNINGDYTDIKGFCKAVSIDEVRKNAYVLDPGRYIAERSVKNVLFALLTMILFAFLYFFIFRNGLLTSKSAIKDTAITVQPRSMKDSVQTKKRISKTVIKGKDDSAKVKDNFATNRLENKSIKIKPDVAKTSPASEVSSPPAKTSPPKAINPSSATRYKVISKAYFYDQPNEGTRRRAFINHWNNSYADIKALEEKDGFIYVVFTNHLNQTSRGWLRKKDLTKNN